MSNYEEVGAFMDVTKSDYERCILPVVPYMFKGELTPVEGDGGVISKLLDRQCGIDYLLEHNGLVYGIASRIQRVRPEGRWDTFTVRHERDSGTMTEYEKRMRSKLNDAVCPNITYQAYVSNGRLLSMAVALTSNILECCAFGEVVSRHTGDAQTGQASFMAVSWGYMIRRGYTLRTYSWDRRMIEQHVNGRSYELYHINEDGTIVDVQFLPDDWSSP